MALYIQGIGTISPQDNASLERLGTPLDYAGDKLACVEPDYGQFIDIRQLRRMSRVIKMGIVAGSLALKDSGINVPDGIITGTSYGCLEDTGIFLTKMIDNKEHALNPTPFIQSTHNTIGSQIALMLQCQGYNQTYTQRALSFEHALLDAWMESHDNPGQTLLVGGVDEITETSHTIQKRFGIFREGSSSSLQLLKGGAAGVVNGEGAVYLMVSGEKGNSGVCIEAVTSFYKPAADGPEKAISDFLSPVGLSVKDIDLILLGKSGNSENDSHLSGVAQLFPSGTIGLFKHLCGEYPTATAFAVTVATNMLKGARIPDVVIERNAGRSLKNILIYNSYFGLYHSMILLKAC